MTEAIQHLEPLKDAPGAWGNLLLDVRARLRRLELADKGLTVRHMGPQGDQPDEVLDTFMDVLLATQQQTEEEVGPVRLRPREDRLEDIAWNAVVVGHPNRFEDAAEASDFARLLTRKLIGRGHLPVAAEPYAPAMLAGLMWFLWSSQKTAYLEPELVEGQTGTVLAMLRDIGAAWSPPPSTAWHASVRQFARQTSDVLASLDREPWGSQHVKIAEQIPRLLKDAQDRLARIAADAPEALAGCAAFITGTLAVENRYSPLDGSDDMYEALTNAVWSLNSDNEGRFMTYLWDGFETVRSREFDELARWRWGVSEQPR
jgi:hypothetical protein